MRRSLFLSIALFSCLIIFWSIVPVGCANIIPPQGGPRDTLPPRLLSVTPRDSTLNFRGDRVIFTFDEYIADPRDLSGNILFTPTFEINPEIGIRSRTVTVRFRDSLLPNTTYTLNFGNAIQDLNENNVLKNFVYVFSTGPTLDTISLSGKVTLAETGKYDSTLIVMLHRNLADTAVRKERPTYFARVDAAGNFRFQNLPKGAFAIYALGNASNSQRRYLDSSNLFAFSNDTVKTGLTNNVNLLAYRAAPPRANSSTSPQPKGPNNSASDRRLRFTEPQGNLDLKSDYVLSFPSPLRRFDSSLVSLSTDSTFTRVVYSALLDSARTGIRFKSVWKEGTVYNLILDKEFAEDSSGRKLLKSDTLNFTTKKRSDYAQLNLKIRNIDAARNPVLQFVQNDAVVFSTSIKTGSFRSDLFTPGDYELRILYDTNNNGKWDPGRFFGTKRQPEIVRPVERKLSVKPALDNDFDISL